ncbi:hypothetical protein PAEH1_01685 [Paenalcaligenes hominis]|uniref:HTH araC/xylS-type domain-containing protein n=1 Tax=Paenalcaligenes hominis TaxID=643674 RepID=A0A1U9JXV3_9BURK|nr:AraC family transcriptional regulator [Paenalcaligenes hominis]AQS50586.1 hypothetical protein PAEH1_01685 [Paenalcaligenes hominis]
MQTQLALDVSPIYSYPIIQSRSAVKSHQELSHSISGHELEWRKGKVNTRLFRYNLEQISMMVLGYGAEVEIQATKFQGFSLVQIPLRGTTEIISDGVSVMAGPGETVIVTPKEKVQTLWQLGCEQLLLKIPHHLISHLAQESVSPQLRPQGTSALYPAYKIQPQITQQWHALLQQLIMLPSLYGKKGLNSVWLRHFESNIALFLLSHQPSLDQKEATTLLPNQSHIKLTGDINQTRLLQIKHYAQAHLTEKITLADLASVVGVSTRTLNVLCHRQVGMSPMTWLRSIRLDAVRQALLSNPKKSITELALAHGFEHLGRFSFYYQQRFGELPKDTGQKPTKTPKSTINE